MFFQIRLVEFYQFQWYYTGNKWEWTSNSSAIFCLYIHSFNYWKHMWFLSHATRQTQALYLKLWTSTDINTNALGEKNSDIVRIGGLRRKGSGYCQSKLPRVKNTYAEETYFMSKKACFGDIRDQIFIIKKKMSPGAQWATVNICKLYYLPSLGRAVKLLRNTNNLGA